MNLAFYSYNHKPPLNYLISPITDHPYIGKILSGVKNIPTF